MKVFANFGGAVIIIAMVVALVLAYRYFLKSDPDNMEEKDEIFDLEKEAGKLKKLLQDKKDTPKTVLVNMPVLYYRCPNEKWTEVKLTKAVTTIGRGKDCDIQITDPTVSLKHAQIIMKLRKKDTDGSGCKYFLLKNLSKENPVSVLNMESRDKDEWHDILKCVPLAFSVNVFYIGLVEVRLVIPATNRRATDPGASRASDEKTGDQAAKKAGEASGKGSSDGREAKEEVSGNQETQSQKAQAQTAKEEKKDQGIDIVVNEELHEEQAKIIRRSPRTVTRF